MAREELLEITGIHSVAGLPAVGAAWIGERPFRSPHHGCTATALIGGGAIPRPGELVLAHRGVLFLDELAEFRREVLDQLPVVALATRQADIELTTSTPANDLTELFEQVRAMQQLLLTDADALALRGHLDPKRLEPARNVQGYLATVDSVERLVSLLREDWDRLAPHTPLKVAELDRAVVLAKSLSAAVAARDNGVHRAPAIETRIRVLSKLMRLYDALRRMMTYLRWEQDDVDQLVPSLWASRGRRTRSRNDVDPNPRTPALDDDGEPSTPVPPSPVNGGAPFTS